MDLFPDGLVVRLRSRIRGGALYLYARGDGHGVALSPRHSSPSTAWEVLRFQREGADSFVLRSSATGRSLAAPAPELFSADPRCKRRAAAAFQRDYVEGQRATAWRATWAGLRHGGDVILRDFFFGRKLCAEEEARHGNRVFVQRGGRGKNTRNGTTAASHWFVEAALPLPLRPSPNPPAKDRPRYSCLRVPRLTLDTASSARLPILGAGNQSLGYLPASRIMGLGQLVDGSGGGQQMILRADAAVVGGEASNGQLVTALAFVAGRGRGIITALPLHLQDAPAVIHSDDHGKPSANEEPEPAAGVVVVVGADEEEEREEADAAAQREEEVHAVQLEQAQLNQVQQGLQADAVGQQAQADLPLEVAQAGLQADDEQEQAADEHAAAQVEQLQGQADADAVGQQQVQADVQAAEAAEGHNAGDHVAEQIEDTLSLLEETYEVMMSKHRYISGLVERRRITAEDAAARRDWTGLDKVHRTLQKSIQEAIALYDTKDRDAAGFRDSLVRLGVRRPPSPPPLLHTHPAHLLARRRG